MLHDKSLESSLQDYIRTIWSVALVPAGDISWYWQHIVLPAKPQIELEDSDNNKERKTISQAVENLLEYGERNFIGRRDREGRYERPQFSPEVWSKHDSALQCQTVPTNKAEVTPMFITLFWHLFLQLQVFYKHIALTRKRITSLRTLLQGLNHEESLARERLCQGVPSYLSPDQKKKMEQRKIRFANICREFTRENAEQFASKIKIDFNDFFVE